MSLDIELEDLRAVIPFGHRWGNDPWLCLLSSFMLHVELHLFPASTFRYWALSLFWMCLVTKSSSGFSREHKVLGRTAESGTDDPKLDWLAHLASCERSGLLREIVQQPWSAWIKWSAGPVEHDHSKEAYRLCTKNLQVVCGFQAATWNLFFVVWQKILDLKNECHGWSTDYYPFEYSYFQIYVLAERLVKSSHHSPV